MTAYADAGHLAARAVRLARRTLDAVENALRPDDATLPSGGDDDNGADATTTQDILIPRDTGERASSRATRQAQDYLARRRRKLREDLDSR